MQVKIQNARLAFPSLFEATTVGGEGKPSFGCALLLPLNHPALAEVEKAMLSVANEKWGAKGPIHLKAIKASDKACIHDGESKAQYEGYSGNKFINCRSQVRPTVIDRDKSPLTEADGRVYSGCYINAIIEVWAQDNKYGKRINAQIRGVQFNKDGDAFSGGGTSADADEFDDLAVAGEEGDDLAS